MSKWLTKRALECPDEYLPGAIETSDDHMNRKSLNDSLLVTLQKTLLTFKIHDITTKRICKPFELNEVAARIEPLYQQMLASGKYVQM